MLGEGDRVVGKSSLPETASLPQRACPWNNPHCVIDVDDVAKFPVTHYRPLLERHSHFPQRTNVAWIEWLNRHGSASALGSVVLVKPSPVGRGHVPPPSHLS